MSEKIEPKESLEDIVKRNQKPEDIPPEERIAALTIVWSKDGRILVGFPLELHLAMKMMAVASNIMADLALQRHRDAVESIAKSQEELDRRISLANKIPPFDETVLRGKFNA